MSKFLVESDDSFVKILKRHPSYGPLIDVHAKYELWAVHSTLHWFLLIKGEDCPDLPYITIEIKTLSWDDITPTMRSVEIDCNDPQLPHAVRVGTYGPNETLKDLCQEANSVAKDMGSYNLLNNNCQHFCNNLLTRIGFPTFDTIVGTNTTLSKDKRNLLATIVGDFLKDVVDIETRKKTAEKLNSSGGLDYVAKVYMP